MVRARRLAGAILSLVLVAGLVYGLAAAADATFGGGGQAVAQQSGNVPGGALGNASDSELWRAVRGGARGNVAIAGQNAGVLISSEGNSWRAIRNGPVSTYGGWLMLGAIVVLALFFATRGRIRIEAGPAGQTVERFGAVERFAHWLVAISFVVLALTGLNVLYGRYVLKPVLGPDAFATLTMAGKYAHNYIAFAFMAGLVLVVVLWLRQNLPNRDDLVWLAKGGGLFTKGVHPPAHKFNAGQKIVFWITVLGGLSISLSGLALLFPFELPMFAATFRVLNVVGLDLPANLTPLQEQQFSLIWHGIVSLLLTVVIIAHIYIATIGMEGAFDAMGTGQVDRNWAKEHHAVWLEELERESGDDAAAEMAPGDD